MNSLKKLLVNILNLLFVAVSNFIALATLGIWIFGYFWINAPLDYVPDWLWILTSFNSLILLGFLNVVKEGWGGKYAKKFWIEEETKK